MVILICLQAVINMVRVSGILPVIGIPLPFISYGGSSLLVSMAALGILVNISRYSLVKQQKMKRLTEHNLANRQKPMRLMPGQRPKLTRIK